MFDKDSNIRYNKLNIKSNFTAVYYERKSQTMGHSDVDFHQRNFVFIAYGNIFGLFRKGEPFVTSTFQNTGNYHHDIFSCRDVIFIYLWEI